MKKNRNNHWIFQRFAGIFSKVYSTRLNPLYHLGDIAVLMFIVACVSGVYLFLFYNIDPAHAYDSVENISANPFNAVIRSLHRYSSDLLVVFIILHFIQALLTGKYKRVLSWISGVISLLIVLMIGVTGFILVWDEKGKLIGYLTAKFFTALPIFDPSIAGSFISNNLDYIGGFFKVSLFGHVFFSIFLIIILWLHVIRIAKPKVFSPRAIWIYSSIALLLACLVFPIKSDPSAQERFIPYNTTFDWYYLFGYSLMKILSVPMNWLVMTVSGVLIAAIPFITREKKKKPATIDIEKCDACNRCAEDCPYGAIDMLIRNGERKAILDSDKCISCGICLASCKDRAITMPGSPDFSLVEMAMKKQLTVISCSKFAAVELPDTISNNQQEITCLGDLHSKDIEHFLEHKSDGVLLLGCEECYYRLGKTWAIERLIRKRPPALSKKISLSRVQLITTNHYSENAVKEFADSLSVAAEISSEKGELKILDYLKTNHVISTVIFCVFFLAMPLLSNTNISFFSKQEKLLVLSLKYISSPTEFRETTKNQQRQMQSLKPVVKRRSPIQVEVTGGIGNILYKKIFLPRGWHQDISIFVYSEITTSDSMVNVRISETAFPEKITELKNIVLGSNDGTIVSFADGRLKTLK